MGIIAFLFCLCLCLLPVGAQALSTADAVEAISPEKECALTLSYRYDGAAFASVPVQLYKIADVSADYQYTLAAPFASSGLMLNGIQSAGEWDVIRETLAARILADDIKETLAAATDPQGKASFEVLQPGLYLAVNGEVEGCSFAPALIALPGLGVDGLWQYQITVSPKGKAMPPVNPDEQTEYRVLKLWSGDEGKNTRPQSIQAEIFCNGESRQIVSLSAENNWSHSWTSPKDGASWTVVERNVPAGYVMSVEQRETTFILTNTLPADDSSSSGGSSSGGGSYGSSPKTGDSPHILLYTVLMYVSGIVLVILGITGKRKRR